MKKQIWLVGLIAFLIFPVLMQAQSSKKVKEYNARAVYGDTVHAGVFLKGPSTADTVLLGTVTNTAMTVDSIVYTAFGPTLLKVRIEMVDSLRQATGTLVDTSRCIYQKVVVRSVCTGGTWTLGIGKLVRLTYDYVTTKPKEFQALVCGQ
jgi:hypothetical protein